MGKYTEPQLIISVDGEAASLAGEIFAIGAAVIEARSGRIVDQYMGRLTKDEIYSKNPNQFVREHVINPVLGRWIDIAFVTSSKAILHQHFFAWWRMWSAGTSGFGIHRVIQHHVSASWLDSRVAFDLVNRASVASAHEGLLEAEEIITVADFGFPVESTIFRQCILLHPDFEFLGPMPLHDIATLRLAAKLAAPRVSPTKQSYKSIGGVEHNPLDDAIVSGLETVELLEILRHASDR